jgi:hypothetical protein
MKTAADVKDPVCEMDVATATAVASTAAYEGCMPTGASSVSSAPDRGLPDSLRFYAP